MHAIERKILHNAQPLPFPFQAGVCGTVVMFFMSHVMGAISAGVVLVIAFLFFYFWFAVQKAYVEIGNRDYMYSPAPVKPIYNPQENRQGGILKNKVILYFSVLTNLGQTDPGS